MSVKRDAIGMRMATCSVCRTDFVIVNRHTDGRMWCPNCQEWHPELQPAEPSDDDELDRCSPDFREYPE